MACTSCKKSKRVIAETLIDKTKDTNNGNFKDYIKKTLLFLVLSILLTPVILVIFIFMLFKIVVLSKEINLLPLVYHIAKRIFKDEEDEDEDDDDFDGPLDEIHELAEPDEIIELKQ